MEEILFHGKRIDNGEWVEGYLLRAKDYLDDIFRFYIFTEAEIFPRNEIAGGVEIDPSTVQPYSGMNDKNGKKIFKGDIIRMNQNKTDLAVIEYGKFGCVRIEDESVTDFVHGWYWKPLPTDALSRAEPFCWPFQLNEMWIEHCGIEVIGNIHDNPELLRGGEG